MPSTASPYGLQPISDQSGLVRPARIPFGITNQYNTNIFKWQPVKMIAASGTLQAITNAGGVPDATWGIFAGVEFTPLGGRPTASPFWPAGTNFDPGYDMFVYYWPLWTPGLRIAVQADGSVPQTSLGTQFNVTNITAGSTTIGLSQATVGAAGIAAGSQGQFTLVEFGNGLNSIVGDAFTDLIVIPAFAQVGPAPQKSIG